MYSENYRLAVRLGLTDRILKDEFDWKILDDDVILQCVYRHQMYGLLIYHLDLLDEEVKKFPVWEKIIAKSKFIIYNMKLRSLQNDLFIPILLEAMDELQLKGVFLKGPILQNTVYAREPSTRPYGDIDILMNFDDSKLLYDFLLENRDFKVVDRYRDNYDSWYTSCIHMSHHHIPIYNQTGTVEIHHRLYQYFMQSKPNTKMILSNAIKRETTWGEVWTPDNVDMFITLCYHLFYHHAYENESRLLSHVDIYKWITYMIENNGTTWLEDLYNRVNEHGTQESVLYSLVQTNVLFKNVCGREVIPKYIIDKFVGTNILNNVNSIRSRFLLEDCIYGQWKIPYCERIFMDKLELEREVAFALYQKTLKNHWEEKLESLGIYDLKMQEDGHYW